MKRSSKLLTAVLILAAALFVLTAAIAVPILFRPFYYWQIGPLHLTEQTGLPRAEIVRAYQEMIAYCTGLSRTFSTGVLPWSEVGYTHFSDVRVLFRLDFILLALSGGVLLLWAILRRKTTLRPACPGGKGPLFWAGSGLLAAFVLITGLAALDFDRAFTVFHAIFFPGKTNWLFDPREDAIITILPETFFRNCAICIVALLALGCIVLMALSVRAGKKNKDAEQNNDS